MSARDRQLKGGGERKGGARQGVRRDQASREESFTEGGLKIMSSFVKQSEKGKDKCVQNPSSEQAQQKNR